VRFAPTSWFNIGTNLTQASYVENGMYLGLPLLAVLATVVVWLRRRPMVLFSGAMIFVTYVISLGPRLFVDGHNTGIRLPWTVAEHLPFIQDVLAIRFDLMTQFFAALTLALGLDQLIEFLRNWARTRRLHLEDFRLLAWSVTGAVAVVALAPLIPVLPVPSTPVQIPQAFTGGFVDRIPAGSVVLTYPYPFNNTEAQLDQIATRYRFKIPGGFLFVAGPNGMVLDSQPYPLQPMALIELFMAAGSWLRGIGGQPIEFTTPPYDAETLSAIRTYLVRYSIGTVVVDMTKQGAPLVVHYLDGVLGQPESVGLSDVWFDVPRTLADTPVVGSGSLNKARD
jgi:hypothetical protein